MTSNRITLCASLLASIFESNRELLLELQFKNAIGRYKRDHPVLEALIIGDDLSLDSSRMPDNEDAIAGIKALVEAARNIMEIFVGADEAESRIGAPAKAFLNQHQVDVKEHGIQNFFPDLLDSDEVRADMKELRGEKEIDQLKAVFTNLFSHCVKSDLCTRETIEISLSEKRSVRSVKFEGDGVLLDIVQEESYETTLDDLSVAFNSLKVPVDEIKPILKSYGSIPEDLGLLKKLFGGMLSDNVDFGIGVIDRAVKNEITKDTAFLVRGPKDIARDITTALFAKHGLESGAGVIFVTSTEAPEEIKKRLALIGVDVPAYEQGKRLVFVDWYTKNVERVHGVETIDNTLRCSADLTNVSVGLDTAFKMLKDVPTLRAIIDMVSPAIVTVDFETVLDFVSAIRAKLRSKECTSLVTINSSMHAAREMNALQDNFDGVLDIKRYVKNNTINREISVMGYSGVFTPGYHPIHLDERGMSFGDVDKPGLKNHQPFSHVRLERVTAGIPGLEIITGGGLPKNGTYLVLIPPGMFPSELLAQLINNALKKEHALMVALSSASPSDLMSRISDSGMQPTTYINKNTLRIVDWHTQRNQRVMGVEDNNGILSSSKDIMHLGVAIDQAMKQLDMQSVSLSIIESLSTALRDYDLRTVFQFAQTLRAKMKQKGFTSFVILEKGTQDESSISAIEETFDGTLDISESGGSFVIGIVTMKDTHFQTSYRQLTRLRSGLAVEVTRSLDVRPDVIDRRGDLEDSMHEMRMGLETLQSERTDVERKALEIERKEEEFKEQLGNLHQRLASFKKEQERSQEHREELARVLKVLDDLLENLPEDTIDRFAKSEDFKLYEKIMDKYMSSEDEGK